MKNATVHKHNDMNLNINASVLLRNPSKNSSLEVLKNGAFHGAAELLQFDI
jgi:hypothetical protein